MTNDEAVNAVAEAVAVAALRAVDVAEARGVAITVTITAAREGADIALSVTRDEEAADG
jgi:hypothetical protein